MPGSGTSEITSIACFLFICLVPLAWAGLAILNAGLGRSRSAAHLMMASLSAVAIAGAGFLCLWICMARLISMPGHSVMLFGKGSGLDRRCAVLFSPASARWHTGLIGGAVSDFLRGSGSLDPIGKRGRSMASARELPFDSVAGGVDVLSGALGVGRRLACATRRELWARKRFSGRRRLPVPSIWSVD